MAKKKKVIPNPGSGEAIYRGCLCAQIDNHYGRGINGNGKQFWINEFCPLHGVNKDD